MKYKEVKRPARVGERIRLKQKVFQFNEVGDELIVEENILDMEGRVGVCGFNHPRTTYGEHSLWLYDIGEYVVLEPIEETQSVNHRHRPTKAENYLAIAKAVSERSTCIRRQYGAVIVKNDEIIATGYNGAPRGAENCCDTGWCGREDHNHNDGDYSTCPAVHAEANAIISAARRDMIGSTLYLYGSQDGKTITAEPCPICKGLIANAGIADVVCSKEDEKNDT